ncbi:MAG: thioesterase family protein [Burkholderiales bacterium]
MFIIDPKTLLGGSIEMELLASSESASDVEVTGKNVAVFDVMPTDQLLHAIETAAFDLVNSILEEGYRTVGVAVSFKHFSPVPGGHKAVARLTLNSIEGRKFRFDFAVMDAIETVCQGSYANYVISISDFNRNVAEKRERLNNLASVAFEHE